MPKAFDLMAMNRPLECFVHWRNDHWLFMDAPYQRGVVWGTSRQRNLIFSLVVGIPIPSIVLNDRLRADWPGSDVRLAVIDGKQRITAVLKFMDGKLAVPGEWFNKNGMVTFTDIDIADQRKFHNKSIPTCEGVLPTIEEEKMVFDFINFGGVPQGETDLKRGKRATQ